MARSAKAVVAFVIVGGRCFCQGCYEARKGEEAAERFGLLARPQALGAGRTHIENLASGERTWLPGPGPRCKSRVEHGTKSHDERYNLGQFSLSNGQIASDKKDGDLEIRLRGGRGSLFW